MFGFVFKSKVLGVLEHDFGWKLSTQSLGSIYKVPLDDISKSVKKEVGMNMMQHSLFYSVQ